MSSHLWAAGKIDFRFPNRYEFCECHTIAPPDVDRPARFPPPAPPAAGIVRLHRTSGIKSATLIETFGAKSGSLLSAELPAGCLNLSKQHVHYDRTGRKSDTAISTFGAKSGAMASPDIKTRRSA